MGDSFTIWAASPNAPLIICKFGSKVQPEDEAKRNRIDADWDQGIRYTSFAGLVSTIVGIPGKCRRLAIMAHGAWGLVDIEGKGSGVLDADPGKAEKDLLASALTVANFPKFESEMKRLNTQMEPDGKSELIFMSCQMGGKGPGAQLLKKISETVTNAKIVGFTRIGTSMQVQSVARCDYPGMKVGDYVVPAGSDTELMKRKEALATAPWASSGHAFAKVAFRGKLVKDPEPEEDPENKLAENHYFNKLIGSWKLEIGDPGELWEGFVRFEGKLEDRRGTCFWISSKAMNTRHTGTWKALSGTTVSFEFSDDSPGWTRVWTISITQGSNQGQFKIKERPSHSGGLFRLIDQRLD